MFDVLYMSGAGSCSANSLCMPVSPSGKEQEDVYKGRSMPAGWEALPVPLVCRDPRFEVVARTDPRGSRPALEI
jgi:hypothetical protein